MPNIFHTSEYHTDINVQNRKFYPTHTWDLILILPLSPNKASKNQQKAKKAQVESQVKQKKL